MADNQLKNMLISFYMSLLKKKDSKIGNFTRNKIKIAMKLLIFHPYFYCNNNSFSSFKKAKILTTNG